jgi:hypothetical protein
MMCFHLEHYDVEYQVYTRRRSTGTRRSELERQEMEDFGGQQQQGKTFSTLLLWLFLL